MSKKRTSVTNESPGRVRRTFSDEYRAEAVKMVTEQGFKVAEAARSLGISANLIHLWKAKSLKEVDGESEELKRLRAENKRLRMERDILKKATAFFANEKN